MNPPTVQQIRHTPATQHFLPYWEDDQTDQFLELEALCQRFLGTQQEPYFEALEGQVLFGLVS